MDNTPQFYLGVNNTPQTAPRNARPPGPPGRPPPPPGPPRAPPQGMAAPPMAAPGPPPMTSSASITCSLGKELYERHDDSMLSKIPKDILKGFEGRKCTKVTCQQSIEPGQPSYYVLRFFDEKDGQIDPLFQFYFTPSSGDINIKEQEKFEEYKYMIKNFETLYQSKTTRSSNFCRSFNLIYGNMQNPATFQHLTTHLRTLGKFDRVDKLEVYKARGFTSCTFWHYVKDNKWYKGIEFGGAGANEEVTVRHFFHGEGDSVPNWDSIV